MTSAETNPSELSFPAPGPSRGAMENMNPSTRDDATDTTSIGLAPDSPAIAAAWAHSVHALGVAVTRLVFSSAWRATRRALRISDIPAVVDAGGLAQELTATPDTPLAVNTLSQALATRLVLVAGEAFVRRMRVSLANAPDVTRVVAEDARISGHALLSVHDALADFDSVDRALPPALAALDTVIPVRSAVLLESDFDAARVTLFHRDALDAAALLEHDTAARTAWGELALEPISRDVTVTHLALPIAPARTTPRVTGVRTNTRGTVHLPLIRGGRLIGLLRLELDTTPTDDELSLLAAFATTLAVALAAPERASVVVEARTAAAEHAHRELLAVVSHDLRNPLSAILMSVSLMARSQRQSDARAENNKPIEVIKRSAERLNLLIQNVVDAAHLEDGGLQLARDRYSIAQVVGEATRMLEVQATNRQVKLTTEIDPSAGEMSLDRERIVQTIANVLHATLRFTPKGGAVTVRAKRVDSTTVHFEIQDSSPGFDSTEVLRMFDRRWWSERNHSLGTGLGLAVARGIVRAHGSEMNVASTQGVGNVFSFDIIGESF